MSRFQRFRENVGTVSAIQIFLVALILILRLRYEFTIGLWKATLPCLLISFYVAYFSRHLLVEHFELTQRALLFTWGAMILAVLFVEVPDPEPPKLRIAAATVMGLYIGVFFWVYSDPLIGRE